MKIAFNQNSRNIDFNINFDRENIYKNEKFKGNFYQMFSKEKERSSSLNNKEKLENKENIRKEENVKKPNQENQQSKGGKVEKKEIENSNKVSKQEENHKSKETITKENLENLLEILGQLKQILEANPKGQESHSSVARIKKLLNDIVNKINSFLKKGLTKSSLDKQNENINFKSQLQEFLNSLKKELSENLLTNFLDKNNSIDFKADLTQKIKQEIHGILTKLESQKNSFFLKQVETLSSQNIKKAKDFVNQINELKNESSKEHLLQEQTTKKNLTFHDERYSNQVKKKHSVKEKKDNHSNEQILNSPKDFKLEFKNVANHEILKNKDISKQVINQLNDSLEQAIINNKKITHLQLKPQELGKIEILLHQEQDRIQVKFIVANESVKEIIDQRVQQIRENLAEKQIEFKSFETEIKKDNQQHQKESEEYNQKHRINSTNKKKKINLDAVSSYKNLSSFNGLETKNLSVSLVA